MTDQLLIDTADRLFAATCTHAAVQDAERDGWAPDVWQAVADAGFPWVSIAEAAGGSGRDVDRRRRHRPHRRQLRRADSARRDRPARRLARLGRRACRCPTARSPSCPANRATRSRCPAARYRAAPSRVAWGRRAERVVALLADGDGWVVASIAAGGGDRRARHQPRRRATGHARLRPAPPPTSRRRPRGHRPGCAAAAGRTDAGAHDGGRPRSDEPADRRVHAGSGASSASPSRSSRPSSSTSSTARSRRRSSRWPPRSPPPPPSGVRPSSRSPPPRSSPGRPPRPRRRAAHQAHGAMGMTQEYPLQHLSRRLWSWRQRVRRRHVVERPARPGVRRRRRRRSSTRRSRAVRAS